MDINATLLFEILAFVLFIVFNWKLVWPALTNALIEREQKIADGLAAGEQGRKSLEEAKSQIVRQLDEAKKQAATLLEQAEHRANQIVDEAREKAKQEAERLMVRAQADIQKELETAKQALRRQVAHIAMAGAEKILRGRIDEAANSALLEQLATEI